MPWYAVYTQPRGEKKVAEQLARIGVEVYCPLVKQIRQWSDRKKKVEVPLIPSYVFVFLEARDRDMVFRVPGVIKYVFWLGKPAVIRSVEITALKESLQGLIRSFDVEGIKTGDLMVISQGPFKGKEGIVKAIHKNKIQLILSELGVLINLEQEA